MKRYILILLVLVTNHLYSLTLKAGYILPLLSLEAKPSYVYSNLFVPKSDLNMAHSFDAAFRIIMPGPTENIRLRFVFDLGVPVFYPFHGFSFGAGLMSFLWGSSKFHSYLGISYSVLAISTTGFVNPGPFGGIFEYQCYFHGVQFAALFAFDILPYLSLNIGFDCTLYPVCKYTEYSLSPTYSVFRQIDATSQVAVNGFTLKPYIGIGYNF